MLELRNVTAGYGSQTVLRDVDLVVPDHSVVALLGPNGAGKTTLLRVASGLVRPTAGRLILDGQDATGWPSHRLAAAGVCHVPEGRGIFRALSVRDNIRLQANPALDLEPVRAVAEAFPRLGERLDQRAGTMSGGEQQMLALAHAYVAGSNTVLLDEVSMGLAPKIIDEIFDYLRRLAEKGAALLLVEQYVGRALELADFVYILNKGRVQFVGEAGELGEEQILASYLGVEAS
ncbi:MAG: branched-chain amino acid transport system ATP-binding protein [Actinomycetota bacterium]|nr:branched-chain amino acid transport system ATP-binding protein [Actinomycetota bacterium]MDQ1504564.1 branched-chain amino acid transport system ATP-binding protein [Actinomycetota bacterium]MDQ1567132.1 branched-chain amino acid transport system ATP-binding protein [Actinomycetota bacterium]